MDYYSSDSFQDIPDSAMRNLPLRTAVLGLDGIWDDFWSSPAEFDNGSNLTLHSNYLTTDLASEPKIIDTLVLQEKSTKIMDTSARSRNILHSKDAIHIFLCLLAGINDRPGSSVFLSQQYGVSPKSIRDIWNRSFVIHRDS